MFRVTSGPPLPILPATWRLSVVPSTRNPSVSTPPERLVASSVNDVGAGIDSSIADEPVVIVHGRAGLPDTFTRPLCVLASSAPSTPVNVIALEPVSTSMSAAAMKVAFRWPLWVLARSAPRRPLKSSPPLCVITSSVPPTPSIDTAPDPVFTTVSAPSLSSAIEADEVVTDTLPLTREMLVAPEPLTDVTAVPGGTTMS